jgi:hypothetical protein
MKQIYTLINILFLLSSLLGIAQPNYPTSPNEAQLIFEDVDRFIEAFNLLDGSSDTVTILEEKYFAEGSDGLKEYVSRHGLTSTMLAGAITNYPELYTELAIGFPKMKKKYLKKYTSEMVSYKEAVSDAMFPPTYFLVGAYRGIAQASRPGQLVTIEKNWDNPERKFSTIIHELTHFQQARSLGFGEYASTYGKENNMLDLILREGGAEFVTYYLVRKNTKSYSRLTYVNEREAELKDRFNKDLTNQDKSYWLWDSIGQNEVPILLGYTMGYKICESYYEKATDKEQALKDILAISNPEDFLAQSEYLSD